MKVYVAAGWFTPDQEAARAQILHVLRGAGVQVYSPKDDGLYVKGDDPSKVFNTNLTEILKCDLVVASTEGKDMGTLFECGFAYSMRVPIVYYYLGDGPFNLMLAASATEVVTRHAALAGAVWRLKRAEEEGLRPPTVPYLVFIKNP